MAIYKDIIWVLGHNNFYVQIRLYVFKLKWSFVEVMDKIIYYFNWGHSVNYFAIKSE